MPRPYKKKKTMKKILLAAAAMLMIAGFSTSCKRGKLKGFDRTPAGLHYKFHVKTDSERAQLGDIIIAEIWVYLGDELQFTNAGDPEPMFQVMQSQHGGDLMEALQMIGIGDSVTFAFNLDTLRKYNPDMLDEPGHTHLFYTIKVDDIMTLEEFEIRMEEEQARGEAEELAKLETFLKENRITAKPNADGVYVIITSRGSGAVASRGKEVAINYVGSLLDGTTFDTNKESTARETGLYNPGGRYEPLSFVVGGGRMIRGMDNGVEGLRVGTKARLIIPSSVGYGSRDMGTIPPFSTLIFDIEIVSVN